MNIEEFARKMMEMTPQLVKAFNRGEDNDLARGVITLPQFWALYYLSLNERCKMKKLAEHLEITPAAATGLIDRLIRQKLVVREDDRADRRVVWIELSPKGREMIGRIKKQRINAIIDIFGRLSASDRASYLRILEKVTRTTG